ncbi:MAG: hypothetical protein MRZ79_12335 [Bacteroidia bacterium]|nr:hypothetical protein [Bacteroidia bacterium]
MSTKLIISSILSLALIFELCQSCHLLSSKDELGFIAHVGRANDNQSGCRDCLAMQIAKWQDDEAFRDCLEEALKPQGMVALKSIKNCGNNWLIHCLNKGNRSNDLQAEVGKLGLALHLPYRSKLNFWTYNRPMELVPNINSFKKEQSLKTYFINGELQKTSKNILMSRAFLFLLDLDSLNEINKGITGVENANDKLSQHLPR